MQIKTVKTPGLAHLSYVVIDGGEAAVIDPRLDLDAYLDIAHREQVRITHIFETHRNEDYVSGARALAERTGAAVFHGTALDFEYGKGAQDGQPFEVGEVGLRVLHTPGHTFESISLALTHCQTGESVLGVFTGDALLVNDVGRTDFFPERAREVAGLLYDSLHKKLLPLGDQAMVWPAHGSGSVCGGDMADRDATTVGYERAHNPRLRLDREAFIEAKLAEDHDQPPYFRVMERENLVGHLGLEPIPPPRLVSPDERGALLIDVRAPEAWAGAHARGSVCLPVAMIPSWAGWWLPYDRPLALIGDDPAQLREATLNLARLGYTRVEQVLQGGITAWQTAGLPLGHAPCISVHELLERRSGDDAPLVLDVRKPKEWAEGHVPGAVHIPLAELDQRLEELPRDRPLVTFCASGRRATLAASRLACHAFEGVAVCFGSMAAWRAIGGPVTGG